MKKVQTWTRLVAAACLLTMVLCARAAGEAFESASDAVKNMRVGWNLGNTLDSNSNDTLSMWIEHWTDRTPSSYETAWGQPVTKPELLKMLKEAGFNAVRVPVTWYPHMEAQFNFATWENSIWLPSSDDIGTKIDAAWMQRVHEVVDYVISQGMYCILNVHHDTGATSAAWLIADEESYNRQHERFEAIWKQIAEEFRDYGDHLLFEGYNEMLDKYRSWCFASYGSPSRYDAQVARSAYNSINNHAQSFVDAVRATGGNNANRNLVVCTYGACDGHGSWNTHLKDPLKEMKLPSDAADSHLIFEVHSYPEVTNLATAKSEVRDLMTTLKNTLAAKGAPVIIGEWGTSTENAYENYKDNYVAFHRYFVEQAKQNGICTFRWMGLTEAEHRSVPEFNQPDLVEAIMKGYYGEEGYTGVSVATAAATDRLSVYGLNGVLHQANVPRERAVSQLRRGLYIVGKQKVIGGKK